MKIGVLILAVVVGTASQAKAENPSLQTWTESILSRLPFQSGQLDRGRYVAYTNSFVEDKKAYFDGVFGRLLDKAVKHGLTARADSLRQDHERRLKDLSVNVDLATESIFGTLDPDGDGIISRAEARSILLELAQSADLDSDVRLDREEQRLAEWSLSTGNNIVDKTDEAGLRRQFREIERTVW